ncbi:MAG: hypothetical protein ACYSUI_20175 [Planctomycetota bacterium]
MRKLQCLLMVLAAGMISFTAGDGQAEDCPEGECYERYYCGLKQPSEILCDEPEHVGCCGAQDECLYQSYAFLQWEIADPGSGQANCYRKTTTYCRMNTLCRVPEGGGFQVHCSGDPDWTCELYGVPWSSGTRVDFSLDCEDCSTVVTCYYCDDNGDCSGSTTCNASNCCE